jgi:hypothetical protein
MHPHPTSRHSGVHAAVRPPHMTRAPLRSLRRSVRARIPGTVRARMGGVEALLRREAAAARALVVGARGPGRAGRKRVGAGGQGGMPAMDSSEGGAGAV